MIGDADKDLPGTARLVIERAHSQWQEFDSHIEWCDERIAAHIKDDEQAKIATRLMGVGPVKALVVVTMVGDFKQFKNGAQFGAWLALMPGQNFSRGKNTQVSITKRCEKYLRMLLIQSAKLAVMTVHKRDDPISLWTHKLREKSGWQKAMLALANKNACILWAVMTNGQPCDARHVSVNPVCTTLLVPAA